MKKSCIFVLILGLSILGCESNNSDSRLEADGKGDIDVSTYLPAKAMIKNFTYGHYGQTLYGGEGYQNISVTGNKVYIEQHAHLTGRFYTGDDTVQKIEMSYTDSNITNFFGDSNIHNYTPKSTYRYVNPQEFLSSNSETKSDTFGHGNTTIKSSHECYYQGITSMIKNINDKIIESDGDFLVVECDIETKITYYIDKEYREIDDRNGKYDYIKTKYLAYYKKGIGLIYEEGIDKETIEPCKGKGLCQYDDEPTDYYGYHVNSIDYE